MTTLLALDIGGTKVGWGIVEVGENYTVVERGSIPTEASRGGADVAERLSKKLTPRPRVSQLLLLGSSTPLKERLSLRPTSCPGGEEPLWGSSLRSVRDFLCASLMTSTHTAWAKLPWEPDAPIPQSFRSQ